MRELVRGIVNIFPIIGPVVRERDRLRAELYGAPRLRRRRPPGHFYSPIPSLEEVRQDDERIFAIPRELPGLDLGEERQLDLLNELQIYYKDLPFKAYQTGSLRYFYENHFYSYSDAIVLYCMMRHFKPKRIVEIGSGYSSCAMLDTNERFFDNAIECTFIEPFPKRLLSLIWEGDLERIALVQQRVQDVPLARFELLSGGDFIVIDSTHVSKAGSDVNHIFFEILPQLRKGVLIHFHDILYPFEYPKEVVYEGEAWNESYLLRAFLQYNQRFEIVFFNTFLEQFHESRFREKMPLCLRDRGGSLWIQRK